MRKECDMSPYDLSQIRHPCGRKPCPGSTRPKSDDPYSATTVVATDTESYLKRKRLEKEGKFTRKGK